MRNENYIERYRSLLEDETIFHALLSSHTNGSTLLNQMKKDNPEKEKDINDLQNIFAKLKVVEKELSATDRQRMWRRIEAERKRSSVVLRLRGVLKYAAILIVCLTASFYFLREKTAVVIPVDYDSILSKVTLPEDSIQNVLLVLSDKETIEMPEKKVELFYDAEGNLSVNSSQIENRALSAEAPAEYNQLYVPYGRTTEVSLSDGTKIWVNSGSRLIYPASFAGNRREIFLEGEIYLEVARNEKKPFIVKTQTLDVEVLGTAFNVSAYKNDDTQFVVLANGSVSIKNHEDNQSTTIRPNQKYTLGKAAGKTNLQTVDVFKYICWKYNLIMSESDPLPTVLKKMERYYNVRMVYEPAELAHIQVKGKLDLKNTIEETLQVISMTTPISYTIENKSIKLSVNP